MKNMYSLMLSEDIVRQVDLLAHRNNTSRSHMIELILAEHLSCSTPEQRLSAILEGMEDLLSPGNTLIPMLRSSATALSLRSSLAYKYHPTLRYTLEMSNGEDGTIGRLKVSLRSQNQTLLVYLTAFYRLWCSLSDATRGTGGCCTEEGRLLKELRLTTREQPDNEALSRGIVEYISTLDDALKAFFYNIDDAREATEQVEEIYKGYLAAGPLVI